VRERQPELYGDALHHIYAVTAWQGGEPSNIATTHRIEMVQCERNARARDIVDPDYVSFGGNWR